MMHPFFFLVLVLQLLVSTAAQPATPVFALPRDFYDQKCDPCIARRKLRLRVFALLEDDDDDSDDSDSDSTRTWLAQRSAMEQASRDTHTSLEFAVFRSGQVPAMAAALEATLWDEPNPPDALIVTLPRLPKRAVDIATADQLLVDDVVRQSMAAPGRIPIFGYGQFGYRRSSQLGLLGHVAEDQRVSGHILGQELLQQQLAKAKHQGEEDKHWNALYIVEESQAQETPVEERQEGIQAAFDEYFVSLSRDGNGTELEGSDLATDSTPTAGSFQMDTATYSATSTTESLTESFTTAGACDDYDMMILNNGHDQDRVQQIMTALQEACGSTKNTTTTRSLPFVVATFGSSPAVRDALLQERIQFAAVPQPYLQSTLVVVMASVYVLSGKTLTRPVATDGLYLTGPTILQLTGDRKKLPEDAAVNCEAYAFPICREDDSSLGEILPYPSPILATLPAELANGNQLCSSQGCLHRRDIRLGGALHGTTTCAYSFLEGLFGLWVGHVSHNFCTFVLGSFSFICVVTNSLFLATRLLVGAPDRQRYGHLARSGTLRTPGEFRYHVRQNGSPDS